MSFGEIGRENPLSVGSTFFIALAVPAVYLVYYERVRPIGLVVYLGAGVNRSMLWFF